MAGSSEQTGSASRRWRRKRGSRTDSERNKGWEERGEQVDRRGTDRRPGQLVPGIPAATVQSVLSQTARPDLGSLSVCLSVASCEAHRWAGRWLPTHRSELVLSLQGHLSGETKDRAWSPALTSMLRSRYLSTWGLRSVVLLVVELATQEETQICRQLQGTSSNQQQDHRDMTSLNIRGNFHRHHCPLRCSLPLLQSPGTWRAFMELWAGRRRDS